MNKQTNLLIAILVLLLLPLTGAVIEVKASIPNTDIKEVYALAKSPLGTILKVPMEFNSTLNLFYGKKDTKEAGMYKVTVFALKQIGTIATISNKTLPDIFVSDCKIDSECKTVGVSFVCMQNKCSACKCGLDSICNSCCTRLQIQDFDCNQKPQTQKDTEIVLIVNASEKGAIRIYAFENKLQDLEVTAEKDEKESITTKVQGIRAALPAKFINVTIKLPSGKILIFQTDENGFVRVPIPKDETGKITISAGRGSAETQVSVEVKGIASGLVQAKQAAITTAKIAAAPAAAIGGWAILSFLSHIALMFQSLLTAQISINRTQIGKIKSAVQLIMLSFLLFSLRKLLSLLNAANVTGINFELTYAISEVLFFIVFLIGIMDLNASMQDISKQKQKSATK